MDPISYGEIDKENLFDNQKPLKLEFIFTIVMTFIFDPRVILCEERRSQSHFGSSKGSLMETVNDNRNVAFSWAVPEIVQSNYAFTEQQQMYNI